MLNLFVDLNYSNYDSTTTDPSGASTSTKSRDFNEKYNLNVNLAPYPFLLFTGGGILETDASTVALGLTETRSRTTTTKPFFDLTLKNPFASVTVGYSKREDSFHSSVSPVTKRFNEEYHSLFGWRPEDLPSLSVQFTRNNQYDSSRVLLDTVNDTTVVSSRYSPVKTVDLGYQATYTDFQDRLNGFESKILTQNGRVNYSDLYFDKRVSLTTTYNITLQDTQVSSTGRGEISSPLSPVAGLSSLTDSLTVTNTALDPNPALLDGNVTSSAGIDIGTAPSQSVPPDTKLRNMGVDFLNATEVNELFVWVNVELTPTVAASFRWDVYISADNSTWTLWQSNAAAVFGPFANRFDITFPNATTRYIKVVTSPLSPGVIGAVNFPHIYVTELQAFIKKPSSAVAGETSQVQHIYSLNVRTRLMDAPSLYYDFYYYWNRTGDSVSLTRYTVSNGLSAAHRFSSVFTGNARAAREDSYDLNGPQVTYYYNAAITATPFKTLRHSLLYSGQSKDTRSGTSTSDFVSLYNTAELYKGVTVNLSDGVGVTTSETGATARTTNTIFGAALTPHANLTMNLNYYANTSKQTGGGREETTAKNRQEEVAVTYRPFTTLYLSASLGRVVQSNISYTTQNLGVNWSLLSGGNLQLSFLYAENFRSDINSREKTTSPSLTWKVNSSTTLDMSYLILKSDSVLQTTDTNVFSINMRMLI